MNKIDKYIQEHDFMKVMLLLSRNKKTFRVPLDVVMKEYDPKYHRINDRNFRKDKTIKVPLEGKYDQLGQQLYTTKRIRRCRVSIPIQRVLVERSVGFLLGNPVTYRNNEGLNERQTELMDCLKDVFNNNKMEYNDKRIARTLFSERECAEIWYFELSEDGKPRDMRMKIVSPTRGDGLYPHFDEYDRLDAFARTYTAENMDGDMVSNFDIYTSEYVYRWRTDKNGEWNEAEKPKRHGFTKIPVVYYRQEETEWECVQPIIDRIEELLSNWGDTNDYFGSPSYFVNGAIQGFADKGEQGRVYVGSEGADMRVLSWDSSPQSINNELSQLTNIVFSYTQTPDVSFETMKQLGGNTSGVAIRLMFTDPHMKAAVKIEQFGEMFTRRANIVKDGITTTLKPIPSSDSDSLRIEPVFTPYAPKNDNELISMINTSTGGKATMSQEDGIRLNPLIENPNLTLIKIKEQEQKEVTEIE